MLVTDAIRLIVCPCGCEEVVEVFDDGSYRRPECGTTFRTDGVALDVPTPRIGAEG